jgi:hypothetical protein
MSYSSPPGAIGANPTFTVAPSLVSQFPQLNSADVSVSHNLTVDGHINSLPRLKSVLGFTSTKFSTAAVGAGGRSHLMTAANLAEPADEATANSSGLAVKIPAGSVLHSVQVLADTTVVSGGAATYDIGVGTYSTNSTNLLNTVLLASVNSGVMALGCAGAPACLGTAGSASTLGGGFVNVEVATAANTAGSLKMVINYYEAPSLLNELGNPPEN